MYVGLLMYVSVDDGVSAYMWIGKNAFAQIALRADASVSDGRNFVPLYFANSVNIMDCCLADWKLSNQFPGFDDMIDRGQRWFLTRL